MEPALALSRESARRIVEDSLDRLFSLIQPKGRFIYSYPLDRPGEAGDGYNMLRHCGTLWFMLRAVNELRLEVSEQRASMLVSAVGYAGGKLAVPPWLPSDRPCYGLVTKGAIKVGGVGLMLAMLHEFRRLCREHGLDPVGLPGSIEDTIQGLETYALAQISDGDFLHKRRFDTGDVLPFFSDYYTGEVLLGLFCSDRALSGAREVCERLMQFDYGLNVQSHWMAYAACEAVSRGRVPHAVGTAYLKRLMRAIVDDDAYRARRESTPIACRSEALTRYLILLQSPAMANDAPEPELVAAVTAAAKKNMRLQLDWYRHGQFWKGDENRKVQIDYIQHNATSYLNWLKAAADSAA
jgi:hypothetical protein